MLFALKLIHFSLILHLASVLPVFFSASLALSVSKFIRKSRALLLYSSRFPLPHLPFSSLTHARRATLRFLFSIPSPGHVNSPPFSSSYLRASTCASSRGRLTSAISRWLGSFADVCVPRMTRCVLKFLSSCLRLKQKEVEATRVRRHVVTLVVSCGFPAFSLFLLHALCQVGQPLHRQTGPFHGMRNDEVVPGW